MSDQPGFIPVHGQYKGQLSYQKAIMNHTANSAKPDQQKSSPTLPSV